MRFLFWVTALKQDIVEVRVAPSMMRNLNYVQARHHLYQGGMKPGSFTAFEVYTARIAGYQNLLTRTVKAPDKTQLIAGCDSFDWNTVGQGKPEVVADW